MMDIIIPTHNVETAFELDLVLIEIKNCSANYQKSFDQILSCSDEQIKDLSLHLFNSLYVSIAYSCFTKTEWRTRLEKTFPDFHISVNSPEDLKLLINMFYRAILDADIELTMFIMKHFLPECNPYYCVSSYRTISTIFDLIGILPKGINLSKLEYLIENFGKEFELDINELERKIGNAAGSRYQTHEADSGSRRRGIVPSM